MAVLTYNKAIRLIANADINLANSTANAFYMMLLGGATFGATNTVVANVASLWSTNVANVGLTSVSLDDTTSPGNTVWKAADVTFTASGISNADSFVIYANTSGTLADCKLVCYNSLGSWVNMVANDTLTIYTNAGIIRIDDVNT